MFNHTDENVFKFFSHDDNDTQEVVWEAVSFIDFLKMSNNAWFNGGSFDVDEKILAAADTSAPIKILQRDSFFPENKKELLVLWGSVDIKDSEISIPIRFFAVPKEFEACVFTCKVDEVVRAINLSDYVEYLEESEDQKWADLLG